MRYFSTKKQFIFITGMLLCSLSLLGLESVVPTVTEVFFSNAFSASQQVNSSLQMQIHEYALRYNQPPVNARMDSVWKAIPELNGIAVDEHAMLQQLQGMADPKKPISLVYKQIPPKVSLSDLKPVGPIYRGNPLKKQMALMINVAWGEEYLPSILETLRNNHVKATFFFDGTWLSKHHDLAKIIDQEGHDIGNHGYHHLNMDRINVAKMNQEIADTNREIKQALGKTTQLFAPPSGAFNQKLVEQAKQYNMHTILWTLDTVDWKRPPSSVIVQRIVPRAENGALVLMHPTAPTADALRTMIPALKAKGFDLVTVSELLNPVRLEPKVTINIK